MASLLYVHAATAQHGDVFIAVTRRRGKQPASVLTLAFVL
jgi:hypothetical protein